LSALVTKLVYRTLGLPAERAGLSRRDIARLTVAESLLADELQAAMDCGDEYHDAFPAYEGCCQALGGCTGKSSGVVNHAQPNAC